MTTTPSYQATDSRNPANSMSAAEAERIVSDVADLCLFQFEQQDVLDLSARVGRFTVAYNWVTGKTSISADGLLLFVAVMTGRQVSWVSWRQAGQPWRREFYYTVRGQEAYYMQRVNGYL